MSTEYEPDEKPVQERRDSYEYQFTAKKLNAGTEAQEAPSGSRKFRHPFHRDVIDSLLTVINKELLFCKLFYFFFFGAFGSLFPLLAIYFKQLGMSASQSGVLIGFRPFIEFLSVPFWTGLADKWRRGKEMLLFSLLCWVVFTLAIAFVRPPAHKCLVYNGTHTVMEIPYATRRRRDVTSVHLLDEELRQYGGAGRRVVPPDEVLLTLDGADHLFVSPQARGPVRNGYNLLDPSVSVWAHASQPLPFNPADNLAMIRQRRASAAHRYKVDHTQIANANASDLEGLITSKFSTVVYKQDEVQSDFLVLLLIVILGEFFSAPAITFADCVTLSLLGEDTENYGRQRMFGSLGWGLAMFFVGMALDHATTFPQHPCGIHHPAEKNYTVCFATFSVLMSCAFLTALQFQYHFHGPARDIALAQLTEKVKDKAKRIITGRKKIDRERLVEEDTDEEYGPSPGPGQGGYPDGGSGYSPESARKPLPDAGDTSGDQKLRIKPSLKNDMVTDALRAPGASAQRVGGPYHNTKGSAVPPGQYSSEPFFGKWKAVVRLLWSYQYLSVLFVAWFMGFGIGLIFTFLFWHLQDLGGSPTLFGVASVINHVSELFAYFMSSKLLITFGHVKVLYAGLLGNVARFLYISWLRDPYWVLPFEFVQGLTHAAVWAACCAFITSAIPGELKSSAQGILQALHHGLGRGCGAVFGGLMVSGLGSEVTFRAYGVTCIFVLAGYAGVNLYLQRLGRFSHSAGLPREVVDDTSAHLAPHGVPSGGVGRNVSAPKLAAGNSAEESAWNVQPKADYGATTQDGTKAISDDKDPWGVRESFGSSNGYSDGKYGRDNPFQQQSFDHRPYQEQGRGYQEQGRGRGFQEQGQGRGQGPIYTGDVPRLDTQVYRQQPNNYYDQGYGP